MLLQCSARHWVISRAACSTGVRMASTNTVMGRTGRVYNIQGEVARRSDPKLSIFKAESQNESFVFKRVSLSFYRLSQRLAAEFSNSQRLRIHVDSNEDENILFYPYFNDTLLPLIRDDPELSMSERKKILRSFAEAIQELHHKNWIHIDIKPDNVLVNWTCNDADQTKIVTDAVLGDFDIAYQLPENGEPLRTPYAIGNVMWRSPEGQTGQGVTKASDIFSYALVMIYTLGGGELLLINNYQDLVKRGIQPELEIVVRHFAFFGLVNQGLLDRINDERWRANFEAASKMAEDNLKDRPQLSFDSWGKEIGPAAQDLIAGMTRMDPDARLTIEQVLEHPWWDEDDDE